VALLTDDIQCRVVSSKGVVASELAEERNANNCDTIEANTRWLVQNHYGVPSNCVAMAKEKKNFKMAQSGIFNVQEYGILPGQPPGTNTVNLQALVDNLLSGGADYTDGNGGTISFPSTGTYEFDGPINISASPAPLIFMGTGAGKMDAPLLRMTASQNFFVINNSSPNEPDRNIGGIIFQAYRSSTSQI
jgi:hypothetical protein